MSQWPVNRWQVLIAFVIAKDNKEIVFNPSQKKITAPPRDSFPRGGDCQPTQRQPTTRHRGVYPRGAMTEGQGAKVRSLF